MARTLLLSVGLLVACALAGAEDFPLDSELKRRPAVVPLPKPVYSATEAPYAGLGFSIGPIWPTDPTLDMGLYAVGQFSAWITPYVAFELDVGHTKFDDDYYGGELTVNPIGGYVVVSLPLAPGYAGQESASLRLAAGGGRLSNTHTLVGVEDEGFFALQAGIEWVIPDRGRLFIMADTMWSDIVIGDTPIFDPGLGGPAMPFWDLEVLTALRIGFEFTF